MAAFTWNNTADWDLDGSKHSNENSNSGQSMSLHQQQAPPTVNFSFSLIDLTSNSLLTDNSSNLTHLTAAAPNTSQATVKPYGGMVQNQSQQSQLQLTSSGNTLFDSVQPITVKLYDDIGSAAEFPSLYSAKSFQELGLKDSLLNGVYAMGFNKPSDIQGKALPVLLRDPPKNFIGQAPSGTGKTAAYVLTMLQRIDFTSRIPQSLCVCPTRELTRQVADVIRKLGKYTDVSVCEMVKNSKVKYQRILDHVVVGTPGSLLDAMRRGYLDTNAIRTFVLDEADNMLEQSGLGDQTIRIKKLIKASHEYQIMLFSATYPEHVKRFSEEFVPRSNQIFKRREELTVEEILQICIDCDTVDQKYDLLCALYDLLTVSQSIIFCQKKQTADEIGHRMKEDGHNVKVLHGNLTPEERDNIIDDFRKGRFKVLISSNVLSRGIDITQISLVINYDLPINYMGQVEPDVYLHRIGRTGRFGRRGVCVNFVHDRNMYLAIKELEECFQTKMLHISGNTELEEFQKILKKIL